MSAAEAAPIPSKPAPLAVTTPRDQEAEDTSVAGPQPASAILPSETATIQAVVSSSAGIFEGTPDFAFPTSVVISLFPYASAIIVNGVTSKIHQDGQKVGDSVGGFVFDVDSQIISLSSASQFAVDDQIHTPGVAPIDIQGTPLPLAPTKNALIVAGNIVASSSPANNPNLAMNGPPFITVVASQYIVGSQVLLPGAPPLIISGTPVNLAPSGAQIVIGSSTIAITPSRFLLPPLTIGSQVFTANSKSGYVIGRQTLRPGQSPITVPQSFVRNSNDYPLTPTDTMPKAYTVGNQVFTPSPTAFPVGGTTISAGGPGVTIAGTPVSLGSLANLIIGTSTTTQMSAESLPEPFIVGNQIFTPNPTAFAIGGATISAGGPGVSISGIRVSLGPSGDLVIGTSTATLLNTEAPPSVITVGDKVFTPNPFSFPFEGTTISAGGPGVTIAGTPIILGPSGELVIGTSTTMLLDTQAPPSALTVGNEVLTPNPTAFSIDKTTLSAGGPGSTVAGTPISLGLSGDSVIGTSTMVISTKASVNSEVYTVGGQVFTPNPTALSIDGTTVLAGGVGVTIAGTPVSLASNGNLVVGNSTLGLGRSSMSAISTPSGISGSSSRSSGLGPTHQGSGVRLDLEVLFCVMVGMGYVVSVLLWSI